MASSKDSLPPITVRKAEPTDTVRVYRLVRKWAETKGTPFLGRLSEHKSVSYILNTINNKFVRIAECEGRLVGALGMSAYVPAPCEDDQWVLDGEFFAIAPGFERRGVGAALLRQLRIQTLKNPITVRLNACFSDLDEIQDELLKKMGFQAVGTVYVLPREEKEEELSTDAEQPGSEQSDGAEREPTRLVDGSERAGDQ